MKRYLLIAGTEKSGTTSVYHYLNSHPDVVGSTRKETDFFRRHGPCASGAGLDAFDALFASPSADCLRMEASPGYLVDSEWSSVFINRLLPDALLLFILRDPIERLVSSFQFHQSRLFLPEQMTFDAYVDICLRYERGLLSIEDTGVGEWFLRVPDAGRYARHLKDYFSIFPAAQIRVKAFDDLNRDPRSFMADVASWAGLDAGFYQGLEYPRANVTFSPKSSFVQRVALLGNHMLEPVFNRYPGLKRGLLRCYLWLNGRPAEKPVMSKETRRRLVDFYSADLQELRDLLPTMASHVSLWMERHAASVR